MSSNDIYLEVNQPELNTVVKRAYVTSPEEFGDPELRATRHRDWVNASLDDAVVDLYDRLNLPSPVSTVLDPITAAIPEGMPRDGEAVQSIVKHAFDAAATIRKTSEALGIDPKLQRQILTLGLLESHHRIPEMVASQTMRLSRAETALSDIESVLPQHARERITSTPNSSETSVVISELLDDLAATADERGSLLDSIKEALGFTGADRRDALGDGDLIEAVTDLRQRVEGSWIDEAIEHAARARHEADRSGPSVSWDGLEPAIQNSIKAGERMAFSRDGNHHGKVLTDILTRFGIDPLVSDSAITAELEDLVTKRTQAGLESLTELIRQLLVAAGAEGDDFPEFMTDSSRVMEKIAERRREDVVQEEILRRQVVDLRKQVEGSVPLERLRVAMDMAQDAPKFAVLNAIQTRHKALLDANAAETETAAVEGLRDKVAELRRQLEDSIPVQTLANAMEMGEVWTRSTIMSGLKQRHRAYVVSEDSERHLRVERSGVLRQNADALARFLTDVAGMVSVETARTVDAAGLAEGSPQMLESYLRVTSRELEKLKAMASTAVERGTALNDIRELIEGGHRIDNAKMAEAVGVALNARRDKVVANPALAKSLREHLVYADPSKGYSNEIDFPTSFLPAVIASRLLAYRFPVGTVVRWQSGDTLPLWSRSTVVSTPTADTIAKVGFDHPTIGVQGDTVQGSVTYLRPDQLRIVSVSDMARAGRKAGIFFTQDSPFPSKAYFIDGDQIRESSGNAWAPRPKLDEESATAAKAKPEAADQGACSRCGAVEDSYCTPECDCDSCKAESGEDGALTELREALTELGAQISDEFQAARADVRESTSEALATFAGWLEKLADKGKGGTK